MNQLKIVYTFKYFALNGKNLVCELTEIFIKYSHRFLRLIEINHIMLS